MTPGTMQQVIASIYTKKTLMAGAIMELSKLWEGEGKPYGSLTTWIEKAVKPSLSGY